jgi:hypothetical protein
MMMAVAVGSIVSLGVASVFTYGLKQFNVLREQNLAQENLLQAAYYLRSYLSQAVKTTCCEGADCYTFNAAGNNFAAIGAAFDPGTPGANVTPPTSMDPTATPRAATAAIDPMDYPVGVVDCRAEAAANYTAGAKNPIGLFVRESGRLNGANMGTQTPISMYLATGLYFKAPTAPAAGVQGQSGVLYLATGTQANPNTTQVDDSAVFFDKLVSVGVRANSVRRSANPLTISGVSTYYPLQSMDLHIVARYFYDFSTLDYRASTTTGSFRDIDIMISVGFRNNVVSYLAEGSVIGGSQLTTPERLHGGLYYFRMGAPTLQSMQSF